MILRYFFKFDQDGAVCNWQIAETDETAARLHARGFVEVTHERYRQLWRVRDHYAIAALPLLERTV